ncbi:MAG: hypothetical protein JWO80_931 [Bryobacterales bacterium]|nr:hypothetical protein [Bryobacterales bacterium]
MAAASQMHFGKTLYRDIWYDKPPLAPIFYYLIGPRADWTLRLAGALYCLLACFISYLFARDLWTRREGLWAAGLMAFFLTFDIPASVVPIGPDLLMLVPHLAAVWLAWRGRALWSGVLAGIAFLCNVKGLFVLAACAVFCFPALALLSAGFAIPCVIAAAWLPWNDYVAQVWIWGSLYAGSTFLVNPVWNGLVRTLNWLGFHAALVAGAIHRVPWKFVAWLGISFAAVVLGWRFFPRYYLQLLPPMVIVASRMKRRTFALLLLIPLIRFGPRYVQIAMDKPWSDVAMDRDSREAATLLRRFSKPDDTLFIWGYRPELWVYTGLRDATRFLDSQPLTGVPADRHLTQSEPVTIDGPRAAREELARSRPSFVLDGLSAYNPKLAIGRYPELRDWFAQYKLVARTGSTLIYQRTLP